MFGLNIPVALLFVLGICGCAQKASIRELPENIVLVSTFETLYTDLEIVDEIVPAEILHNVDEISVSGELLQKYNFLVYRFERNGLAIDARAYLDMIGTVSYFCPRARPLPGPCVQAPEFEKEVFEYLKRRFHSIDRFDLDRGYVTVWEWEDN